MNYKFFTQKQQETPQTQPIPGREAEMIQGRSGGWMFDAGIWKMLRRCLLIGTAQSTYYAGKRELTEDFVAVVKEAVAQNPTKVAEEILYASDGRSINNSAPIFALVLLSMGEAPEAKKAFQEIFPQVVRTGSHFYEWLNYTKSLRGFGKVIREVGKNWLSREDVKALAYQLLKYQQRQGFSHRDALLVLGWVRWASSAEIEGFRTPPRAVDSWTAMMEFYGTQDPKIASQHRAIYLRQRLESMN